MRKSHPSKIVGEGSGFIATMEDMDELDIPAAGMYKLGEEIVQGSEKLEGVGDLRERPRRLGPDSDSGVRPGLGQGCAG